MSNIEKKKKIVIYTSIVGNYDNLKEIKNVEEGIDYYCFTDNIKIKSKTWKIVPLSNKCCEINLNNVKCARYHKIMSHVFFKDYEMSLWVDGKIGINGNVKNLILKNLENNYLCIHGHPIRNCIYAEGEIIKNSKIDKSEIVEKQMRKYREENYPKDYGLVDSCIIFRKHNDLRCIKICEDWWREVKDYSKRDQLSFNYVFWKNEKRKFKPNKRDYNLFKKYSHIKK